MKANEYDDRYGPDDGGDIERVECQRCGAEDSYEYESEMLKQGWKNTNPKAGVLSWMNDNCLCPVCVEDIEEIEAMDEEQAEGLVRGAVGIAAMFILGTLFILSVLLENSEITAAKQALAGFFGG